MAAASLLWLAGCGSSSTTGILVRPAGTADATGSTAEAAATTTAAPEAAAKAAAANASATAASADATGSVFAPLPARPAVEPPPPGPWSAAEDPGDALSLGKRHFREENYGLAEMYFRRVVEHDHVPAQRKAEAWVGLAASYDRLKRFDLADRAYAAAIGIIGLTPEILNNQGFSYMLRGDYDRARAKLTKALEKDPTNPYIQNNLQILEKSIRGDGGRKKV